MSHRAIFYYNLKQTKKARLENVQYQAAKLVTGAYNLSSKQKLNRDLGWETIQCRADILGLNIFHKIHVKETRPLIRNCMPKLDRDKELNLRSKITYQPFKTKSENFCKSFFPHVSKIWNNLANDITNNKLGLNWAKLSSNWNWDSL